MVKKNKRKSGSGKNKKSKTPSVQNSSTPYSNPDFDGDDGDDDGDKNDDKIDLENLDYEDPRPDEEVEELAIDSSGDEAAGGGDDDDDLDQNGSRRDRGAGGEVITTKVWLPPRSIQRPSSSSTSAGPAAPGEELACDETAYDMLHALRLEWPCLSFDVMRDGLGMQRRRFPHTMFLAAGTQADERKKNKLVLLRLSDLSRTGDRVDDEAAVDADGDDSGSEAESEPLVFSRAVRHVGCVNRVRCLPQHPELVATWADTGKVHVHSLAAQFEELQTGTGNSLNSTSSISSSRGLAPSKPDAVQAPVQTFSMHPTEGFALAWSPVVAGRLLSGDCRRHIYLHEPQGAALTSWAVNATPFVGHTDSVEDLQWKPDEDNVFASCSVDKTVRIWDARAKQQPALTVVAHDSDVNVIAWNAKVSYLVASGADDGGFKIWDLRMVSENPGACQPEAHFTWHDNDPITGLEWSYDEESVLAVSSEHQCTVWDLSLERDVDEEREAMQGGELGLPEDVPPQLYFVHMGQKHIKEVHWHPQIPGSLVTTSYDGLNVFRPSNL